MSVHKDLSEKYVVWKVAYELLQHLRLVAAFPRIGKVLRHIGRKVGLLILSELHMFNFPDVSRS